MDHQHRDVVTHVHKPDQGPYDQEADPEPGHPLPGWRSFALLFTAPTALIFAGMVTYAGGANVHRGQIAAGVALGVVGIACVVALWVRGGRG